LGGWAAIGAVGAATGPPLGGLLTEISWHWIFIVNVPLSLLAVIAAYRALPEIRDRTRPPLPDGLGTAILTAAIALATLALVEGSNWSWDGRVIGCFAAALALAGAFVVRSLRHRAPVLELSILRVRAFALASLSATLFFASFSVMLLGNVLFLTGVWRYSVIDAGLALTPGPFTAAALAPVSGRLAARFGPGVVGGLGAMLFMVGSALFIALVGLHPSYAAAFLPGMLIGGTGVGLALPSLTVAATRTLKPQLLATGIGAQTMFRQIGGALGVAALVAILGTPSATDVLTRYDNTRWFMAASSLAAGLALTLIRRPSATPAQRRVASLTGQPAPADAAPASGSGTSRRRSRSSSTPM
jgi:MFS family permease